MVRLIEVEGKLNKDGCIELPDVVVHQTGICTGDSIKLVYMADVESKRSINREFLLLREGQKAEEELMKEQTLDFQIPQELLEDAGIPLDADLDIVCKDKMIVILPTEDVEEVELPEELMNLCEELGIPKEKINVSIDTAKENNDEECGK